MGIDGRVRNALSYARGGRVAAVDACESYPDDGRYWRVVFVHPLCKGVLAALRERTPLGIESSGRHDLIVRVPDAWLPAPALVGGAAPLADIDVLAEPGRFPAAGHPLADVDALPFADAAALLDDEGGRREAAFAVGQIVYAAADLPALNGDRVGRGEVGRVVRVQAGARPLAVDFDGLDARAHCAESDLSAAPLPAPKTGAAHGTYAGDFQREGRGAGVSPQRHESGVDIPSCAITGVSADADQVRALMQDAPRVDPDEVARLRAVLAAIVEAAPPGSFDYFGTLTPSTGAYQAWLCGRKAGLQAAADLARAALAARR